MNADRRLDLSQVVQSEADALIAARSEASRIHASGDIRAAGNQVEQQARETIGLRLGSRFRITHGHVIDYNGAVSPQMDIIIADGRDCNAVFRATDGTEYVPYEAVYAIGEVKSTYYKADKPVEAFCEAITQIKQRLRRQPTSRNPLFAFALFVASNDLDLEEAAAFLYLAPIASCPSAICWLDVGVLSYCKHLTNGLGQAMPVAHYLAPDVDAEPGADNRWTVRQWGETDDVRAGGSLAGLLGMLFEHLNTCVVATPNLDVYLRRLRASYLILDRPMSEP